VIQFIIRYDGNLTDIKILRDIGDGCGQALADVINRMPKWNVGKQNGKPVSCLYTFPFDFFIQ
jgi:protein TonB